MFENLYDKSKEKKYKYVILETYEEAHCGATIEDKGVYNTLEEAFLNKPEDDVGGYWETRYLVEVREV